jgi:dTDP-4-dehydrorhamnose 3,5-epimerase
MYKVTEYYSAEHDAGIAWDDPALAIEWPVGKKKAVLSEKDGRWTTLAEVGRVL